MQLTVTTYSIVCKNESIVQERSEKKWPWIASQCLSHIIHRYYCIHHSTYFEVRWEFFLLFHWMDEYTTHTQVTFISNSLKNTLKIEHSILNSCYSSGLFNVSFYFGTFIHQTLESLRKNQFQNNKYLTLNIAKCVFQQLLYDSSI